MLGTGQAESSGNPGEEFANKACSRATAAGLDHRMMVGRVSFMSHRRRIIIRSVTLAAINHACRRFLEVETVDGEKFQR
jgi:hypothetical protein